MAVRVHVSSKENSVRTGRIRSDFVEMELTLELHSADCMGYEGLESSHRGFKSPELVALFPGIILESLSEKAGEDV